jgi:hypothetical protein
MHRGCGVGNVVVMGLRDIAAGFAWWSASSWWTGAISTMPPTVPTAHTDAAQVAAIWVIPAPTRAALLALSAPVASPPPPPPPKAPVWNGSAARSALASPRSAVR